jgi:hypothetical protein
MRIGLEHAGFEHLPRVGLEQQAERLVEPRAGFRVARVARARHSSRSSVMRRPSMKVLVSTRPPHSARNGRGTSIRG